MNVFWWYIEEKQFLGSYFQSIWPSGWRGFKNSPSYFFTDYYIITDIPNICLWRVLISVKRQEIRTWLGICCVSISECISGQQSSQEYFSLRRHRVAPFLPHYLFRLLKKNNMAVKILKACRARRIHVRARETRRTQQARASQMKNWLFHRVACPPSLARRVHFACYVIFRNDI